MTTTPNYGLRKPSYEEHGDVADLNYNMDIVDGALAEKMPNPTNTGTQDQILRSDGQGGSHWDNAASQEEVGAAVTEWLEDNVPTGTTVVVDRSLSIDGAAADAKKTGDALSDLNSATNFQIDAIKNEIGLSLHLFGIGVVQYTEAPVISGISLVSGNKYTIKTKGIDTPKGTIYCKLYNSGGTALDNWTINASTTTNTRTYTAASNLENAYIAIKVTNASYSGTRVEITVEDITSKSRIDQIDSDIAEIDNSISTLDNRITGAEVAMDAVYPNLWNCNYNEEEYNNVSFEWLADGTYHVFGTASALTGKSQTLTLSAGSYYIDGFTNGGSQTYHLLVTGLDSNLYQTTKPMRFTLASETSITVYIRVLNNITVNAICKPMIYSADFSELPFVRYGYPYYVEGNVGERFADVDDIAGYKRPNLINTKFAEYEYNGITYTINDDGSVSIEGTASALSFTNAEIKLPKGNYLLNGCDGGSTSTYHLCLSLEDSSLVYQYDGKDKPFEISNETETVLVLIRVKSGKTVDTTIYPMIRKADIYNPTYAQYGKYQIYKPIQELINYTSFNWSGKKMNVLGDSIVAGGYGNFVNVIRDILCLSVARNYGIGGSCIASTSQDEQYPPAVLRYTNMDNDADIIIVHAGTNDYSAQVPLGETNSQDITTFNGALNVLMDGLKTKYPKGLIIFSNILDRIADSQTIPCQTYRDALEAACRRNRIVFYNGYTELNFDFHKGYYNHILTVDGLHPNQEGANIMGRCLAGFINWH